LKAYVFPGQGSQSIGMGNRLFDEYSDLVLEANDILGYSIKDLCLEDPNKVLGDTNYTQPALFVVNAMEYLDKLKNTSKPDFVAGHSLGEYNALFAAGVISFETGLRLVQKRGQLMSEIRDGGMAAVLGLEEDKILQILQENNLNDIYIANYNSPSQVVISGRKESIECAQKYFEQAGARAYVVLKVSGAFHSVFMSEARDKFEKFAKEISFAAPGIPVISNVTALPYEPDSILKNLVSQITSPVRWVSTIQYLISQGIEEIEQVGPGNVLTSLTRQIKRDILKNGIPKSILESSKKAEKKQDTEKKNSTYKFGSELFQKRYGLKYPYIVGSMYKGISSAEIVIRACKAGLLAFYGSGGVRIEQIENAILKIKSSLTNGETFGVDLIYNAENPEAEEQIVDLLLKYKIKVIETSAYINISPALARYKIRGLKTDDSGNIVSGNRVIAKLSRPEVAENFLSPIPEKLIEKLYNSQSITREEAELARRVPIADEVTAEADSAGHTDCSNPCVLWPSMILLCKRNTQKYKYSQTICIGAAGGIGTPEAIAAAFMLGADYVVTGSINQCTVEAATSDAVKDLLQKANIQDTDYTPAGDMFELGAKVQVLKKGLFFPMRANKLFNLYRNYNSLSEIGAEVREQIQNKYFHKSFDELWKDIKQYKGFDDEQISRLSEKSKMAYIFKWYFGYATRNALGGNTENVVDFQVYCGPAMGAFNQYVRGTSLDSWHNRHVDNIGMLLMDEGAKILNQWVQNNK
jgi:trans-AT polyketide synthase, acyltransferase and oxidoreductase domains